MKRLLRKLNFFCKNGKTIFFFFHGNFDISLTVSINEQGWIHGYPSHVRVGRSSAEEGHYMVFGQEPYAQKALTGRLRVIRG